MMTQQRSGSATRHWMPVLGLILAVALSAGCGGNDSSTAPNNNNNGGGDNPTVSAEMAGLYHVVTRTRDCQTNAVIDTTVSVDTLCVGAKLRDAMGEGSGCTLTPSGNGYRLVCDMTQPFETGCNLKIHVDMTLTYTNSSYLAQGQMTTSLDPAGCNPYYTDECMKLEVVGTKTGPVPSGACH